MDVEVAVPTQQALAKIWRLPLRLPLLAEEQAGLPVPAHKRGARHVLGISALSAAALQHAEKVATFGELVAKYMLHKHSDIAEYEAHLLRRCFPVVFEGEYERLLASLRYAEMFFIDIEALANRLATEQKKPESKPSHAELNSGKSAATRAASGNNARGVTSPPGFPRQRTTPSQPLGNARSEPSPRARRSLVEPRKAGGGTRTRTRDAMVLWDSDGEDEHSDKYSASRDARGTR
eukprot:CAMPEP_0118874646 /NCGR_PEP_ID=MMETSP1163-20130328/16010_1 /TAXON_ID=124430 /ORGANISM="Phaeomonas parva, Strain CCMP2877" /LENGTH=234 /DNA_ID=CAMNT_0006810053 /DNA_START=227 /DNA_END=927 /DNA_ORIENTATION=+